MVHGNDPRTGGAMAHHEEGTNHPSPLTYAKVAVVLAVITAVEFTILYAHILGTAVLIGAFLGLSAVKFALVAMFYMHLRFDSRLYAGLFNGGLVIAISIVLALIALFAVH